MAHQWGGNIQVVSAPWRLWTSRVRLLREHDMSADFWGKAA
ncbi:hypothetical protein [Alloactinosynnema sp. L-07]|nr:hypothetical protein [Alloactinosynnema sp. L-07]